MGGRNMDEQEMIAELIAEALFNAITEGIKTNDLRAKGTDEEVKK